MIDTLAFTIYQATLSALGSVMAGFCLAYILMRFDLDWSKRFENLLFLPFFLPPLAVILGVIALYGRGGLNLGFDHGVYGLPGILISHWVLNIPLAMMVFVNGYRMIAEPQLVLARQFGQLGRLVDRDVFAQNVMQAFALCFLFASLSFTIILTLGKPGAQTIEFAIYQAIRFDFDFTKAVLLSLLQLLIGLALMMLIWRHPLRDPPVKRSQIALDWPNRRWLAIAIVGCGVLIIAFILVPLLLVLMKSLRASFALAEGFPLATVMSAMGDSFALAALTALIAQALLFAMFWLRVDRFAWAIGAISPLVIATALILLLRPVLNPFAHGVVFVALLQAVTYLPIIAVRWRQALAQISKEEQNLSRLLIARRATRFRLIYLPYLRGAFIQTTALIFALSLGDLALMPLFAPPNFETLPVLIWQFMGSYRFDQAFIVVGLTMMLSFLCLAAGQFVSKENQFDAEH